MVPAVVYLRMSDDRQSTSIADQRSAVTTYAKKQGFRIIREYRDEGISGDATEHRLEFRRMLQEAAGLKCEAVLCWNSDRFGRFDPLEAGYWIKPLRDAGIYLQTVTEGRIDWTDFAGRVLYSIQQEGKHAYLKDLSRNVSRGMLSAALQGKVVWSSAPLGYRVEGGKYVVDEETAPILRRIFRDYLTGHSTTDIARALNAESVKPPRARTWSPGAILQMLKREQYTGVFLWNMNRRAKYHEIRNGEVMPVDRKINHHKKAETDIVRIEDAHEPLISRKDWERVQKLIAANTKNTSPRGFSGPFALRGLLKCGSCGAAMHGRRRDYGTREVFYVCSRALHDPGACWTNAVHQRELIQAIAEAADREILPRYDSASVAAEVRRLTKAVRHDDSRASLERRIASLDARIAKAADRAIEFDGDALKAVKASLDKLVAERKAAAVELAEAAKPIAVRVREFRAGADGIRKLLAKMQHLSKAADPRELRLVLTSLIEQAVVHVEAVRQGPKKRVSRFKSLKIRWKT